jgi:hypothetical protein
MYTEFGATATSLSQPNANWMQYPNDKSGCTLLLQTWALQSCALYVCQTGPGYMPSLGKWVAR